MHPAMGLDHILAMVGGASGQANGRAQLGGRLQLGGRALCGWCCCPSSPRWSWAGCWATGVDLPAVEFGIGGSVVLLGLLIAPVPVAAPLYSMGTVAAFAIFHGFAHGARRHKPPIRDVWRRLHPGDRLAAYAIGIGLSAVSDVAKWRRSRRRRLLTGLLGIDCCRRLGILPSMRRRPFLIGLSRALALKPLAAGGYLLWQNGQLPQAATVGGPILIDGDGRRVTEADFSASG